MRGEPQARAIHFAGPHRQVGELAAMIPNSVLDESSWCSRIEMTQNSPRSFSLESVQRPQARRPR